MLSLVYMEYIEQLTNLGLNEKEARVYLTLLSMNKATAYYIAQKSGLKKPTTYVILEDLVKKSFVLKIPQEKKSLYMAKSPRECISFIQQKINETNEIIPELLAMQKGNAEKTKVSYYEGTEGIKEVYNDTLKYQGELVGFGSEDVINILGEDWAKKYLSARVKNKISVRAIFSKTEYMEKELVSRDKEQLRVSKLVDKNDLPFSIEIDIYGESKVSLISSKEVMATIIESKEIHDAMKSIFELLWKNLPDSNKTLELKP